MPQRISLLGEGYDPRVLWQLDSLARPAVDEGFKVRIGEQGFEGDEVLWLSRERLEVQVSELPPGLHAIEVTTPSGRRASLADALQVLGEGGSPFTLPGVLATTDAGPSWPSVADANAPEDRSADGVGGAPTSMGAGDSAQADAGAQPGPAVTPGFDAAISPTPVAVNLPADGCAPADFDEYTISFFPFEGSVNDMAGGAGSVGANSQYTAGSGNCASGLALSATATFSAFGQASYAQPEGSVDFWYRPLTPPISDTEGLMSHASAGQAGSLEIYHLRASSGRVLVHLTHAAGDTLLCSDSALSDEVWTHIGVNYGPAGAELHINGRLQQSSGSLDLSGATVVCGQGGGAATDTGAFGYHLCRAGLYDTAPDLYCHGVFDNFRVSRARRAFGQGAEPLPTQPP